MFYVFENNPSWKLNYELLNLRLFNQQFSANFCDCETCKLANVAAWNLGTMFALEWYTAHAYAIMNHPNKILFPLSNFAINLDRKFCDAFVEDIVD